MKNLRTLIIALCFIALIFAFSPVPVNGDENIYINIDGSINSDTVPITSLDNITYTLTGNITNLLILQRNGIIINGNGFFIDSGIILDNVNRIIIKNSNISIISPIKFISSSYNTISDNNIYAPELPGFNPLSVYLDNSDLNVFSDNLMFGGLRIDESQNNTFSGNIIYGSEQRTVSLDYSSNNTFLNNNIKLGAQLDFAFSSDNKFFNNTFERYVYVQFENSTNIWNNNYWFNEYNTLLSGDGPFLLDENNVDYPDPVSTPTPSPSPSPTPTSTATPTPTSTTSPTPSPTPIPSPTISPTPTPIVIPTPTPIKNEEFPGFETVVGGSLATTAGISSTIYIISKKKKK